MTKQPSANNRQTSGAKASGAKASGAKESNDAGARSTKEQIQKTPRTIGEIVITKKIESLKVGEFEIRKLTTNFGGTPGIENEVNAEVEKLENGLGYRIKPGIAYEVHASAQKMQALEKKHKDAEYTMFYPKEIRWVAVLKRDLAAIKKKLGDQHASEMLTIKSFIPKDIYEALKTDELSFIGLSYYNHTVWDEDGDQIPTQLQFDYIDAQVHNKKYDLKKLKQILEQRAAEGEKITVSEIQKIPYYNQDGGRHHYLPFSWTPRPEHLRKVTEIPGYGSLTFRMLESDFLGIEAARRKQDD